MDEIRQLEDGGGAVTGVSQESVQAALVMPTLLRVLASNGDRGPGGWAERKKKRLAPMARHSVDAVLQHFTSRPAISVVPSVARASWFRFSALLDSFEQWQVAPAEVGSCTVVPSWAVVPPGPLQARSQAEAQAGARAGAARARPLARTCARPC